MNPVSVDSYGPYEEVWGEGWTVTVRNKESGREVTIRESEYWSSFGKVYLDHDYDLSNQEASMINAKRLLGEE